MPDKYDEVAREVLRLYEQKEPLENIYDDVIDVLRSAFPPPAEDARQCARSVQSHGITFHKNAKGEPVMYDRITKSIDEAAAEIESFAQSRVEPFRRVLEQYADDKNWRVDESVEGAVARLWMEPGSSTPTAYHGFELAQRALLSDAPAKEKTT